MKKTAVILFNLGGPDSLEAVRPFLFNLFNDGAIIPLPQPLRFLLAKLISARRDRHAREIYRQMGGRSPILEQTQAQAAALEAVLGESCSVFVCMRYWHPRAADVVRQVMEYGPDEIILLPLYPQLSTSTTASSLREWRREASRANFTRPTHEICCYPTEPRFIAAHAALIQKALPKDDCPMRLLFSAHGLPERTIRAGDPYQWQVEQTVRAIVTELAAPGIDYAVCYQSKVGRLQWIGPSTEEEIRRAASDRVGVMVAPVSFVSEHSETLVELDIDYKHLAESLGVKQYLRVPALGCEPLFIGALAEMVKRASSDSARKERLCPASFAGCACKPPSAFPGSAV